MTPHDFEEMSRIYFGLPMMQQYFHALYQEYLYNRVFGFLPFLPVVTRRKVARDIAVWLVGV